MPSTVRMVLNGLTSHLLIVGTWIAATLAFVGIGTLIRGWWGQAGSTWRDVSASFWLGIGGAILILQVWHLAVPVDGRAVLALAAVGIAGLRRLGSPPLAREFNGRLTLVVVVLVVWIANRSLGPTALFDTGMYHQPVVAWTNAHPIVPGLGNLHGRLAFNSASLLLASVFDVGPLDGASLHVMNGLLIAALLVEGACAWASARGTANPRAHDLFSIAILPNVVHAALRQDVRSLSTDAAVCALLFAATRLLFDHLAHLPPAGHERARRVPPIVFLFTAAVTVKLSAAMVAAAGSLLALWTLRPAGRGESFPARRLAVWLSPAAALFVAWLVRGGVLSGYPLYPAALLPMPVDWRVPAEQVAAEAGWITMSARNLNTNVIYPGLAWVGPWLRGVIVRGDPFAQLTVPALLTATIAAFAVARRHRVARPLWSAGWARTTLPLGMGLVFWIASAPHTRMAQAPLWSVAAIALAWWCSASAPRGRLTPARRLMPLVAGVIAVLVVKQAVGAAVRAPGGRVEAAVDALLTRPREGTWMAPLPEPVLASVTLDERLSVAMPADDNACWNTRRVCTPHPSATLRLRRPEGSVEDAARYGFRSAGERWAPQRWPNPWTPYLAWWRCVRDTGDGGTTAQRRCLTSLAPRATASAGPAPTSPATPAGMVAAPRP